MGLNAKLSLSVSILLLVVMVPYYYLNVETIRRLLTEEAVAAADKINETIIKTTYHKRLENDRQSVYGMIEDHVRHTGSALGTRILDNWELMVSRFVKVMPIEYKRVLQSRRASLRPPHARPRLGVVDGEREVIPVRDRDR